MITDEPSVLTWMIALAPRAQASPAGHHWWRELVTDTWRCAYDQWQLDAEAASNGWKTELHEFKAHTPVPRLSQFMIGLSRGSLIPEYALEVRR